MSFELFFASPAAHAQQWYLPQKTTVFKKGHGEIGTQATLTVDEDGVLNSRQVDINITARYAPLERLEVYIQAPPYVYHEQERIIAFGLHSFNEQGPGDVFAQINYELLGRQDWKLTLTTDASIPTGQDPFEHTIGLGSGFYSYAPGLTYLRVVDPAVLFFYIGNQWTVPRRFRNTPKIGPGNDTRFRLGASLLLNPRLRATLYTTGDLLSATRLNNSKVAGSDGEVIRVGGGMDWNITEKWRLDVNSVFGVTNSASDATMSIGINRAL